MSSILLSTTNTLEGWEIKEYFGTISANAVIGANLLSDIAASWTDVFGGRSETYEKRLYQIYREALSALEDRAFEIGANCVVGLSIDIDEISGKGSQMFMITAYGTAVDACRMQKQSMVKQGNNALLGNRVNNRVRMLKIRKLAENGHSIITYIDEIIENEAYDLAEYVLRDVCQSSEASKRQNNKEAFRFFASMPPEQAIDVLYRQIVTESNYQKTALMGQILKRLDLIDYAKIPELIKSEKKNVIIEAMQLLMRLKKTYVPEDEKISKAFCQS